MTKLPELCLALAWGLLLGAYYFGGLWWTVRRLPGRARPGRLLLASFGLRLVPVMLGLALLLERGPAPMAVALGGLVAVRIALTRRIARG
ncbi:MAG: ATP synthase subunit I [Desulfobacteraceae bacterium]|jgi:F1F0 ATPase subunit 2|nr:ATP synthase subunit I [Desulfobacteraceae bacterium]